jgi:alpha-D-ribose 1-methylphosphonate 5-triphosphate synthase subunit PhnG
MMDRPSWMAVLARAAAAEIEAALATAPPLPSHRLVRGPEIGLTMLRGRAGGDGAAFNLSEATVTRCTVSLPNGAIGHGWRLGRDKRAAELAAVLDAVLQDDAARADWLARVVAPLAEAQRTAAERDARRAAATEVRFATLAAMR